MVAYRGGRPLGAKGMHWHCSILHLLALTNKETTPRRRAAVVALRHNEKPLSYRKIAVLLSLSKSTCLNIVKSACGVVRNERVEARPLTADAATADPVLPGAPGAPGATTGVALVGTGASSTVLLTECPRPNRRASAAANSPTNTQTPRRAVVANSLQTTPKSVFKLPDGRKDKYRQLQLPLRELLEASKVKRRSGRSRVLSDFEKKHLLAVTKRNWLTRHMSLRDIQLEAGLSRVSTTTIVRALREHGIKSYREQFKPILDEDNMKVRLDYCKARRDWTIEMWSNYGFTDEMSIEIGGLFGVNTVWRDKTEKWHKDCMGTSKKQGGTVMCWGMIAFNYKGPFHVWESETPKDRAESDEFVVEYNKLIKQDDLERNLAWKGSPEWIELRKREKDVYDAQQKSKKAGGSYVYCPMSHRGKKYKTKPLERSKKGGIDSFRYVKHVARPLLWPACKELIAANPNFIVMEDNAASHKSIYTTREREKEGIDKVNWPPNSPDFNPIERIWTIMKRRIQRRRGAERVTTEKRMKEVLVEEWNKITIEEINKEIARLPRVMDKCINVDGGNNFNS